MAVETLLHTYLRKSVGYFTLVGVLVIAYVIVKAASSIWTYFFSSLLGFSFKFKNAGSWAVVTGCTDGIGKAYAENLAKRGLNVVLISRSKAKLQELSNDLEKRYKVQTRIITADFTKANIYDDIRRELSGLDVGTLVNNVALCYEHLEFFHLLENREQLIKDMINCNITSVSMMTSLVLPSMLTKKKGVIINISSGSGRHILPLLAVYSGTKAFVDFFSRCLHEEYKSSGIIIQDVVPLQVVTKMNTIQSTPTKLVPSPETFVRSALNTVGWQSCTTGYWPHAIQDKIFDFIPAFVSWKVLLKIRADLKRRTGKTE